MKQLWPRAQRYFTRSLHLTRAEADTAWRWRFRRPGRPHGLPHPLVVSLTSYPKRYGVVARTLQCLLTQTVQPDHVVLWVGHEDYSLLPLSVLALQDKGLEIRTTEDLRAYTKIIPSLEAFPDAYVCTADDDLYYHSRWLEELIADAAQHPDLITCFRAHEILSDPEGVYLPYNSWNLDTAFRGTAPSLFPTGCGGVLYPPGSLGTDVCDSAQFRRLSPLNDDIWLFWMARKAGTRHQTIARRRPLVNWRSSQATALHHHNVSEQGNDPQIRAMAAEYGYPTVPLPRTDG